MKSINKHTSEENIIKYFGLFITAIILIAISITLVWIIYGVVTTGDTQNLAVKIGIFVLALVFGVGIGAISLKTNNVDDYFTRIIKFYIWVFLTILLYSYISIGLVIQNHTYTQMTYFIYIMILGLEIISIIILCKVVKYHYRVMGIPILGVWIMHLLLIVYSYIFIGRGFEIQYFGGNLFLFCMMGVSGLYFLARKPYIHIKLEKPTIDGGLSSLMEKDE